MHNDTNEKGNTYNTMALFHVPSLFNLISFPLLLTLLLPPCKDLRSLSDLYLIYLRMIEKSAFRSGANMAAMMRSPFQITTSTNASAIG